MNCANMYDFPVRKVVVMLMLMVFSVSAFAEKGMMKPVSLSQRVNLSDVVVEGKVVNKVSYWNSDRKKIYTANRIQISKIFHGSFTGTEITVLTEGGTVGMERMEVHPSLELKVGDIGTFMLKNTDVTLSQTSNSASQFAQQKLAVQPLPADLYQPVGSAQGFIKYNLTTQKAEDAFKTYPNIQTDLYTALSSISGQGFQVVKHLSLKDPFEPIPSNGSRVAPSITSITNPATGNNIAASGVYDELEITGSGFGPATGSITFPNADDGGVTSVLCPSDHILSWTDTKINLLVPSGVVTGSLTVYDSLNASSSGAFVVPYSVKSVGSPAKVADLINDNGVGGYSFEFSVSVPSTSLHDARIRFDEALCAWTSATGVHWDTAQAMSSPLTCEANDGTNLVTFDGACNLPVGVLATSYSYYSACYDNGNLYWHVNEIDVKFDDTASTDWYFGVNPGGIGFGQYDFMSYALHELGHAMQLGHFSLSSDVMFWSMTNGATNRTIDANSANAGLYVMDRNGMGPGDNSWDAELAYSGFVSGGSFVTNPCGPSRMIPYTCGIGPSCWDGILNQDETSIDCGGTLCQPCSEMCSNGIQDGAETNVDCGGACIACCVPPANDSIQGAVVLSACPSVTSADNTCAYNDPAYQASGVTGDNMLWYSIDLGALEDGFDLTISNSSAGGIFEIVLAGNPQLPQVIYATDSNLAGTFSFTNLPLDSVIYIGIGTSDADVGTYDVCATPTTNPCIGSSPANDSLCNAIMLSFVGSDATSTGQTNDCAHPTDQYFSCVSFDDPIVWYSFVMPNVTDNSVSVNLFNSTISGNVHLILLAGDNCGAIYDTASQCGMVSDTFMFYNITDTLNYYLGIATEDTGTGNFDLVISSLSSVTPCVTITDSIDHLLCYTDSILIGGTYYNTATTVYDTILYAGNPLCDSMVIAHNIIIDSVCLDNDACTDAILLICGDTLTGSTIGAAFDNVYSPNGYQGDREGVWYKIVGTGAYTTISTCSMADFDTKLDIYWGTCGSLIRITGNDDFTQCTDFTSQVTFYASNGTEYLVFVHGYGSEEGVFSITNDCTPNYLFGNVYNDENGNCVMDSTDYGLSGRIVSIQPGNYYAYVTSDGSYSRYLPNGTYTVSLMGTDYLRDIVCPAGGLDTIVVGSTDSLRVDFALQPTDPCPEMEVEIGTWAVRPCFNNYYCFTYENVGTAVSLNTEITVELDSEMSISWTNGNITSVNADSTVYTFNVGDIYPGEYNYVSLYVYMECDLTQVGFTKCVKAWASPENSCTYVSNTDSTWDKSSLSVEGGCSMDSLACFTISNTGEAGGGDMAGPSEYRIYENDTLVEVGTIQLNGQESTEICYPARANTIRLEADQRSGHPGNSQPRDHVEGCGAPDPTYVIGMITNTPDDDADVFVDIDCHILTTSYDPNDKYARPEGVTDEYHYIDSSTTLEYTIRFQNTGTDTAFKVIVRDTIDPNLDIQSYEQGFATHEHTTDFLEGNVIQWTFENILLPDSGTDQPGSNGMIRFTMQQNQGNTDGTVIRNNADIFFDYNEPVRTNTTFHTIGEVKYFEFQGVDQRLDEMDISVYPNPAKGVFVINTSENPGAYSYSISSVQGTLIKTGKLINTETSIDIHMLTRGVYFVQVSKEDHTGKPSVLKLMVR